MKLDTEIYKDIEIESLYNKESKLFYAISKIANSWNKNNSFCGGFNNPIEAVEDVKSKIDKFFEKSPKSYEELAEMIEGSLVWTGYEDCHVDVNILKFLVSSFIKTLK